MLDLLRRQRLSERASFAYFWAIMGFDWLQFTLGTTTPTPGISPWSATSAWAAFAITVLGLPWLYRCNGGHRGQHFLQRYFPLSVTVGWKFVALMAVVQGLIPLAWPNASPATLGWGSTAAWALINLAMVGRIGMHLRSLAHTPVTAVDAQHPATPPWDNT